MPRAPRKAKTRKKRGRYAEFAAEWDRRREGRGAGDWLVDKPELALDAVPFLQTLQRLGYVTRDRRFVDLHWFVMNSDLIDRATGHWSRPGVTLSNPLTQTACEIIEDMIAAGISERLALADAVVELNIDANSFDAAWKRLERLLHEWRKGVGQKPA
jgi:hypothetical protein